MREHTAEINLSLWQKAFMAFVLAALVGAFWFGRLDALRVMVTLVTTLAFINLLFDAMLGVISKRRRKAPEITPEGLDFKKLPFITVFSPMRHEEKVAARHIRSANLLVWPRDRIEFLPLIREDDIGTREVIERTLAEDGFPAGFRIVDVPPSHYGSKPAQLQWGMEQMRGEFYLILDAENVVDPYLLVRTYLRYLEEDGEKLAAVSAVPVVSNWRGSSSKHLAAKDLRGRQKAGAYLDRLIWSWFLPSQQAAEYAKHYDWTNPGSILLGRLTPLPGNSVLFRTSAVKKAGGYDRGNKAEDADLTVALARVGWKIGLVECETREEAPGTFRVWFKQRRRWMDGFLQTFFTHTRNPFKLFKDLGVLDTLFFYQYFGVRPFLMLVNPLVIAMTLVYGLSLLPPVQHLNPNIASSVTLTLQETYSPQAKLMGILIMFLGTGMYFYTLLDACMRRKMWRSAPFMLLAPAYWLCQFAAQYWACKDFLVKAGWHLTEHADEEEMAITIPSYASASGVVLSETGD